MDGGAVGEVRGVKNAAAAAAATKHFQSQCLIYLNGFRLFDNVSALSPPTEQIVKRENLTRKAQRKHSNRVLLTVTSFLEKTTWTGKNERRRKISFSLWSSISGDIVRPLKCKCINRHIKHIWKKIQSHRLPLIAPNPCHHSKQQKKTTTDIDCLLISHLFDIDVVDGV